jgi:MFS family permease
VASALAYRDFRLLWASSLCSWSSQWIQQAALGWVVYEITGSGALLGAVLGARAIPMFLLTPMSGVAADRWDRRRLMQASQALASAVSLAFGAALAYGAVSTWMLFAFTMLMGASNVLDRPARMTTAFELVPREVAMQAVALNTIGFSMMRIFGPAMAGYLIATFGAAGSFFVQGVLYGASALVVMLVAFPTRKPATSGSAMSEMLEGLRFAARDPQTRLLVALGALPFFLLVPVWGTLFPIYAKDVFAAGPEGLGLLLTAVGAGGTLGGFAAHALGRLERQGLVQAAWVLVMCAAIAGVAASPSLAVAMAFAGLGGAAEMAHMASNMAMLQMSAPPAMRGRISSLMMLNPALISVGALVAGPLADLLGAPGASLALAAGAAAAIVLLYFLSPQLREMRLQ